MKVIWAPLALDKLTEAAEFIALDDPVAAENWVNAVFDKTQLLANCPEMGRCIPELPNTRYREILFGHYRIIYSLSREVQILTIRNCRQILSEAHL